MKCSILEKGSAEKKALAVQLLSIFFVFILVLFLSKGAAAQTYACCDDSRACVDADSNCYTESGCYDGVMANSYCLPSGEGGVWMDPDHTEEFCQITCILHANIAGSNIPGGYSEFDDYWQLGGNAPNGANACCGDDSDEFRRYFNYRYAGEQVACCTSPTQCVHPDGTTCVNHGDPIYDRNTALPYGGAHYICTNGEPQEVECNRQFQCNEQHGLTCMGNEEFNFFWYRNDEKTAIQQNEGGEWYFGGIYGCFDYLDTDCNEVMPAQEEVCKVGSYDAWENDDIANVHAEGWYPSGDRYAAISGGETGCTWENLRHDDLQHCNLFYYFHRVYGVNYNDYWNYKHCDDSIDNDGTGCWDNTAIQNLNLKAIEGGTRKGLMVGDFKCGAKELDPKWWNTAMFDGLDNNCNGRIDFGQPPVTNPWEVYWRRTPTPGIGTTDGYIDAEMNSKLRLYGAVYKGSSSDPEDEIKGANLTFSITAETKYLNWESIFGPGVININPGWSPAPRDYFSYTSGDYGEYSAIINKNFTYLVTISAPPEYGVQDKVFWLHGNAVRFGIEDSREMNFYMLDSDLASLCQPDCTIDGVCRIDCHGYNDCQITNSEYSIQYCEGNPPGIVVPGDFAVVCCSGQYEHFPRADQSIDSSQIRNMLVSDMRVILHRMPAVFKSVLYR